MRKEFPRKVRAAAIARANGRCEKCSGAIKGSPEVDHILECALGGEPVLANAQVLCGICHKAKTAERVRMIRKADRQRDRHTGAIKPTGKLQSAGFPRKERQAKPSLPPRQIYRRAENV